MPQMVININREPIIGYRTGWQWLIYLIRLDLCLNFYYFCSQVAWSTIEFAIHALIELGHNHWCFFLLLLSSSPARYYIIISGGKPYSSIGAYSMVSVSNVKLAYFNESSTFPIFQLARFLFCRSRFSLNFAKCLHKSICFINIFWVNI